MFWGHVAVIVPNGSERSPSALSPAGVRVGEAAMGGGLGQTPGSVSAMAGPPQPWDLTVGSVVAGLWSCCLGSGDMWDVLELQ